MNPDFFNGLFEFVGGCMLWRNVIQLYKDKMVRGVHWGPTLFFSAWGIWNLFYYPNLDQWWSFSGGIWLVTANMTWFWQMILYRKQ